MKSEFRAKLTLEMVVSYFDFAHLCALASLREITS